MTIIYVAFETAEELKVTSVFAGPQAPEAQLFQGEVQDSDPRLLAFLASLNPPPDVLSLQSAKLQGLIQLAAAQKTALSNRIGDLEFAVADGIATPEEEAELPVRQAQFTAWSRYSVYLGRVTKQSGWFANVVWPAQPAEGMDLTVSASAPETV